MAKNFPIHLALKAVDGVTSVFRRISQSTNKLTKTVEKAATAFESAQRSTRAFTKSMERMGDRTRRVGRNFSLFVTAPIVGFGVVATKAFANFEDGLIGVAKTTDLAGSELDALSKAVTDLSLRIPVSSTELLNLAQAAGQLGVRGVPNLVKFSETIAKLGRASDLSGPEAALTLARILNVTKESIGTVDKLASVIVRLGNEFATTEAPLARMTNEVVRSTSVFRVSSANAAALATAMLTLGIKAESGGSVVGRTFFAIDKAVRSTGKSFAAMQKVTGIKDLKKVFATDSVQVFQKFVEGIGKISKNDGDVLGALSFFGLSGIRINNVLLPLAKNTEKFAETLVVAQDELIKNTALNNEFARSASTLSSKAIVTKNAFFDLSKTIGAVLEPTLRVLLTLGTKLFNFFKGLNPAIIKTGVVIAGLVAAIGPLLIAIGGLLAAIPFIVEGFIIMKPLLILIGGLFTGMGAAIAIIVIGFIAWGSALNDIRENWFFLINSWPEIKAAVSDGVSFVLRKMELLAKKLSFGIIGSLFGDEAIKLGEANQAAGQVKGNVVRNTIERTNHASVSVDFSQLPRGARVKSTPGAGSFNLGLGFAGALE